MRVRTVGICALMLSTTSCGLQVQAETAERAAVATPMPKAKTHTVLPGDRTVAFQSGGVERKYLIHIPEAATADNKLPAVLVFHGGGGTPDGMVRMSAFNRIADEHGFAVVYPAGFERSWNDGRGTDTWAGTRKLDDLAFVEAMMDRIVAEDNVDPDRIYATGMSNGGMLTENLGCRLSDRLAAIAPVAGPLPASDRTGCMPARPLPVLEIHGTADPVVPYDGGVVRHTSGQMGGPGHSPVLTVAATQQLWRKLNHCGEVTTRNLPETVNDGTAVITESSECAGGTRVQLYSVLGGGHTWPGGPQFAAQTEVGNVSHQFDASAVIWQFFENYRR